MRSCAATTQPLCTTDTRFIGTSQAMFGKEDGVGKKNLHRDAGVNFVDLRVSV